MSASTVFGRLAAAGVVLSLDDTGGLRIRGTVSAELLAKAREHRAELRDLVLIDTFDADAEIVRVAMWCGNDHAYRYVRGVAPGLGNLCCRTP